MSGAALIIDPDIIRVIVTLRTGFSYGEPIDSGMALIRWPVPEGDRHLKYRWEDPWDDPNTDAALWRFARILALLFPESNQARKERRKAEAEEHRSRVNTWLRTAQNEPGVGLMAYVRDPEIQESLRFMVALNPRQFEAIWLHLRHRLGREAAEWLRSDLGEAGAVDSADTEDWTEASLDEADFPEPAFVVDGILPEGLTLLAGSPKIGKSWLGLTLGRSLAGGGETALGSLACVRGEALLISLEDTPRRLKHRLAVLRAGDPNPATKGLHLRTRWRRMDEGGLDDLASFLDGHPGTRLVVIDTWAKSRPKRSRGRSDSADLYEEDYLALAALQELAGQYSGLAMMVVFHLRKAWSSDLVEMVSGTVGNTGAVDTIWVLRRGRAKADGELYVTGRDIADETTLGLRFEGGLWTCTGSVDPKKKLSEHWVRALQFAEDQGLVSPSALAAEMDITSNAAQKLLVRLEKEKLLVKVGRGVWQLAEFVVLDDDGG